MKVTITSRKLIKPEAQTPQTLNKHKLSFLDKLNTSDYTSFVLFYSACHGRETLKNNLEQSLAKTLSHFYPFAGRYNEKEHSIDCNDSGAEYIEAKADHEQSLFDFIAELKENHQQRIACLLPESNQAHINQENNNNNNNNNHHHGHRPLLVVQVTTFECGGVAVTLSVSHKVADAESFGTFLTAWGNENNPAESMSESLIKPRFDGASLFPYKNMAQAQPRADESTQTMHNTNPKMIAKRFSFNNEAITRLRSNLTIDLNGSRRASRVVAMTALITKALIDVDRSKQHRTCLVTHVVNLRNRTVPPLPKNCCGNFGTVAIAEITATSMMIGFEGLVSLISNSIDERVKECAQIFDHPRGDDGFNHDVILNPLSKISSAYTSDAANLLMFTDLSKFRISETDFGWGKPVMASPGIYSGDQNFIMLMSDKDGDGIEAWIFLNEDDMRCFEQSEDVRMFGNTF